MKYWYLVRASKLTSSFWYSISKKRPDNQPLQKNPVFFLFLKFFRSPAFSCLLKIDGHPSKRDFLFAKKFWQKSISRFNNFFLILPHLLFFYKNPFYKDKRKNVSKLFLFKKNLWKVFDKKFRQKLKMNWIVANWSVKGRQKFKIERKHCEEHEK